MQRFLPLLGNGRRGQRSSPGVITGSPAPVFAAGIAVWTPGCCAGRSGGGAVKRMGVVRDGASPAALFRHPGRGAALRTGGGTRAYRPVRVEPAAAAAGTRTRDSAAGAD